MTEAKHTPGSWTIEEYGDDEAPALVIHKDSEIRICFMATPGSLGDAAEIEANARLIAAAPDMLEALYTAKACLERLNETERSKTAYGDICAAIAKATGAP